jgi:hypothetical protein
MTENLTKNLEFNDIQISYRSVIMLTVTEEESTIKGGKRYGNYSKYLLFR